jgi:hypothetical protein
MTLAIGIGASTAMFSVVDGVVFQPLPYRDSDQLVVVESGPIQLTTVTPADLLGWRLQNQLCNGIAGFAARTGR